MVSDTSGDAVWSVTLVVMLYGRVTSRDVVWSVTLVVMLYGQ